jgi:hypothetical protein
LKAKSYNLLIEYTREYLDARVISDTEFRLYLDTRDPVPGLINTYVFFQQTDMWLSNAKSSFFTKGILEAFDVIYEILGKIYLSWKNGNLICKIS